MNNVIEIFNTKVDSFKSHKAYGEWLRKYADDSITFYAMCGFYQIKAEDFINRIVAMPIDYINDWLNGKNNLEWKPEFKNQ